MIKFVMALVVLLASAPSLPAKADASDVCQYAFNHRQNDVAASACYDAASQALNDANIIGPKHKEGWVASSFAIVYLTDAAMSVIFSKHPNKQLGYKELMNAREMAIFGVKNCPYPDVRKVDQRILNDINNMLAPVSV